MPAIGHRRTAALFLVVSLLVAAVPAAAASQEPAPEPNLGSSVLQCVSSWLAAVWPGLAPVVPWDSAQEPLDSSADLDGASPVTDDEQASETELGPDLDPDG